MKIQRRRFLEITVLLVGLLSVGISARAGDDKEETRVRWDIVSLQRPNFLAGGIASARNNNNDKITVTGSGTFFPGDPEEVTGGGDFTIVDKMGRELVRGTYQVTKLVSFELAPGGFNPVFNDLIGDPKDARAGLAVLRIRYSDGRRGILVVSCGLGGTPITPPSVFEGITASHAFSDFWNREAPSGMPFIDANRTLFHIVPEAED